MAGKKIPHNKAIEKKILGHAMLEPDIVIPKMQVQLDPSHFYSKKYRELYKGILKTYEKHKTVEPSLIKEQTDGQLSAIGGISGLMCIADSVTTATEFDHYADLLIDYATRRTTLKKAWELADLARDKEQSTNSIMAKINRINKEIASESTDNTMDGKDLMKAFDKSMEKMEDGRPRWEGVSWGLPELDKIFGGLQRGTLSFLIGPTSIGKSMFVCNLMYKQVQNGLRPGYIDIELPLEQVAQRMFQLETGLSKRDIYSGLDQDFFVRAKGMIKAYPWRFLCNVPDLDDIALQVMRWSAREKVDIIYLDYMQVVNTGDRFRDRLDRYSHIITTVKNLATRFDIPIIFLSQVSREAQKKRDYNVHSVKYTGDAENEADKLFWLEPGKDTERGDEAVSVKLVKGKDNQGSLAETSLKFNYKTQQVEVSE